MTEEAALATYQEERFDGKRQFTLFPGRMDVSSHLYLGARAQSTVLLEALNPVPGRIWARPKGFWSVISMIVLPPLGPIVFQTSLSSSAQGFLYLLPLIGAMFALATWRRVEWALFSNSAGIVVLAIALSRKRLSSFQPFVDAVSAAIVARQQALLGRPSPEPPKEPVAIEGRRQNSGINFPAS
jgi:hypothetical protein